MTPVPHRPGNTGDATRTFELIPTHHRDRPSTKLVTAINEFMFIITYSRVTSFDESVSEAKRPLGHASHVCVCVCVGVGGNGWGCPHASCTVVFADAVQTCLWLYRDDLWRACGFPTRFFHCKRNLCSLHLQGRSLRLTLSVNIQHLGELIE